MNTCAEYIHKDDLLRGMMGLIIRPLLTLIVLAIVMYVVLYFVRRYLKPTIVNSDSRHAIIVQSIVQLDTGTKIVNLACNGMNYIILYNKNREMIIDKYISSDVTAHLQINTNQHMV